MDKCRVKRMSPENEGVTYPTIGSIHKVVLDTGRYPTWSYSAFREILLGMDIKMKAKSDIDRSILIEDDNLTKWRERYLKNMEGYRLQNRPIFYTDETHIDPHAQPPKFLTDCTILSADDANTKGNSSGLQWNASRGNRLLILHMIGSRWLS